MFDETLFMKLFDSGAGTKNISNQYVIENLLSWTNKSTNGMYIQFYFDRFWR